MMGQVMHSGSLWAKPKHQGFARSSSSLAVLKSSRIFDATGDGDRLARDVRCHSSVSSIEECFNEHCLESVTMSLAFQRAMRELLHSPNMTWQSISRC